MSEKEPVKILMEPKLQLLKTQENDIKDGNGRPTVTEGHDFQCIFNVHAHT